jgi:hypothetical protein
LVGKGDNKPHRKALFKLFDGVLFFLSIYLTKIRAASIKYRGAAQHQLLILNRSRLRAPSLRPSDRIIAALSALFVRPARLIHSSRPQTIHIAQSPSNSHQTKISIAVFFGTEENRPQGTESRPHPGGPRNEAPQSHMGMSPYRSADCLGLRNCC